MCVWGEGEGGKGKREGRVCVGGRGEGCVVGGRKGEEGGEGVCGREERGRGRGGCVWEGKEECSWSLIP